MANTGFFDYRREWSRWKHEILRRYLPKFAGILGSRHATIYYIDGFAGAGSYRDKKVPTNPSVPGSPLIAAQLAHEIISSGRWPYELRCVNLEPNASNFAALTTVLGAYQPPLVNNLSGTFRQNLDEILRVIGGHPALFFLDPFGYKGMEWDAMCSLASRSAQHKTELIVNFNVGKVDRDAGWLRSRGHPAAPAFVRSLNELMGTDDWQKIAVAALPKDQRDVQLTMLYCQRLADIFHGTVCRYPVRTIDGKLKYFILHVTAHLRGAREMSDVLYRVGNEYESERERVQVSRGKQLSLFDALDPQPTAEAVRADVVAKLSLDICALGRKRGRISFGNLQDLLVEEWFARAITPHYREACKQLIREGQILREKETGIDDRTILVFRQ